MLTILCSCKSGRNAAVFIGVVIESYKRYVVWVRDFHIQCLPSVATDTFLIKTSIVGYFQKIRRAHQEAGTVNTIFMQENL
jgi:hypothetical protein